ncbi:MAG: oligosaccharide flippase family protein, partial [Candidatus Eisenbacteria bacterium]
MESESDPASTRAERLSGVALRNVAAATATRVSTVAVGIVLTPIVLAGLGREMYGVAQVVNSLYDFISLLRGGLSAALRRYVTLAHHSNRSEEASLYFAVGFWWSGLLRTGILLLGWAVAWPLGRFLRLPESMHAEATFGIVLIIAATVLADAGAMFEIPIFATGRTAILSLIRAGATWVRLALTIVAFRVFHPTLPVFGAVLIVVELVPLLLIIPIAQRMGVVRSVFPRWTSGSDQARRVLFSYGRLAVLGQAAALLYTSSDSLFIGRIYGAAAVTAYTLGARWSSLIRGFLLASITSLTPLFTQLEAVGESHRTRRALTEVVKLSAAVAVPFCLTPCVVGDIL